MLVGTDDEFVDAEVAGTADLPFDDFLAWLIDICTCTLVSARCFVLLETLQKNSKLIIKKFAYRLVFLLQTSPPSLWTM
jgi:hypothetical protein